MDQRRSRLAASLSVLALLGCAPEAPVGPLDAGGSASVLDASDAASTMADAARIDAGEEPEPFVPFAQTYGSPGAEYVKAMTTSHAGEVLVATLFSGTIELDGAGRTATSRGSIDTAIVAYDPETGLVSQSFPFGGEGMTVPHGIAVGSSDARIVVGYSRAAGEGEGRASYDPAGASAGELTFSGGEKPFVARYSAEGALEWARMIDATDALGAGSFARAWDVAVDDSDAVYVVGHFRGTFDLDPGAGTRLVSSRDESTDLFVLKLDRDGALVWGFALGGPGPDAGVEGAMASPGGTGDTSIAIHGDQLFVQGTFTDTASLAGTSEPSAASELRSAGASDLFVARFDAATGAFQRALRIGNESDESAAPGTMRIDAEGRLYLAARTSGAADWSGVGSGVLDGTGNAVVVLSLDTELGFRWAARLASTGGNDGAHRVVPDGRGVIYVAGWSNGVTDFDPGAGEETRTAPLLGGLGTDTYLLALRDEGTTAQLAWVATLDATLAHDTNGIPAGLAVDPSGHPWIGGQFFAPIDLDPGAPTDVVAPVGANDGFVVRIHQSAGTATR